MVVSLLAASASAWGVLMGLSPVLQIRRMLRAHSSREVSITYFAVLLIGFLLWIAYGVSAGLPAGCAPCGSLILIGMTGTAGSLWLVLIGAALAMPGVIVAAATRATTQARPMTRLSRPRLRLVGWAGASFMYVLPPVDVETIGMLAKVSARYLNLSMNESERARPSVTVVTGCA